MNVALSTFATILLIISIVLPCFAWDNAYKWQEAHEQINRDIQNQRVISETQQQTFEIQNQRTRPTCQVPTVKPYPYKP